MFKLKNITSGYEEKKIIKNINLEILPNQITTIIGPNGCGKSTLLKTLANSLTPYEGEITLHEKPLHSYSITEFAQHVAILPQVRNIPNTTVEALISHGRFPYLGFLRRLKPGDQEIIEQAMSLTGIIEKRYQSLYHLSGGERQRVYVAMTLAQDTEVILLDEPTTYLDMNHQYEILELVKKLHQQGKTIIMVLHDLAHALAYSDQIIVMNDGEIVKVGNPSLIIKEQVIEKIFNLSCKTFSQNGKTYYFFEQKDSSH